MILHHFVRWCFYLKKYTSDEVATIIYDYGFELINFYSSTNIIAKDIDGYLYKLNLTNLRDGKKPNMFMRNPFALENIKKYLLNNCPDYELLDTEYHGCKEKLNFICHIHPEKGIQKNSVDNIVNSHHYCKYCGYENLRDIKVLNKEEIKVLCKSKNVIYEGRYTKNHESYIQYSCEKHRDKPIQSMSLTHFKESRVPCRYCNVSAGELKIAEILDKCGIEYEKEKSFKDCIVKKPLRFDFYLPKYNSIIEFDGQQHFKPVKFWYGMDADTNLAKTIERDKIKNDYCYDNGIRLIRIPYWRYDDIEDILASEFPDVIFMGKITESSETTGCS